MLRGLAHVCQALDRGRSGADDRYTLVGELVQITGGVAAGVVVVAAAGVKGVPLEGIDSGEAGQLGPIQGTVRHDYVTRAQPVVAIGGDDPSAFAFVPPEFLHLVLEPPAALNVELLSVPLPL